MDENVEPFRPREHEPRHVVGECLAREEHLETSAQMGAGRRGNERMHFDLGSWRECSPDELQECPRPRDAFRRLMVEVDMGMESPRACVLLHFGAAGTSPYPRMTSRSFTTSGGPPALTISPTSWKYCSPMSGVIVTSARAVAAPGLLKWCTDPRGVDIHSPGFSSRMSSSTL